MNLDLKSKKAFHKRFLQAELKIYHVILTVVIALFIVLLLRLSFFAYRNNGYSMLPNLNPEELLIVNRAHYLFNEPERGEIVVFYHPKDFETNYVKRVIGLPGEALQIKDGQVYVFNDSHPTGWRLPEKYLDSDKRFTRALVNHDKVVLEADEYFVLGDNRSESEDSRFFGPVHIDIIQGKVSWKIWWPLKIQKTEYN